VVRFKNPQDILKTSLGSLCCPRSSFFSIFSAYYFYFSFFIFSFYLHFLITFFGNTKHCFFFFLYYVNFYIKTFFYITTCRIIYFNMLCYKKYVYIKINAILNKTNVLQFFFYGRDHHLLAVSIKQQYVHSLLIKIKYDRTIIAKIFVLLIICNCD